MNGVSVGDRVEFLGFGEHDPWTLLEPGTLGTVRLIDDAGTIHVDWDNGGTLGMVTRPLPGHEPGFRPDRYRVIAS